jgi:hypothetical protein
VGRKVKIVEERRAKRAKARAAKLAAMTLEQRAAYDRQYGERIFDPGPAAGRQAKRATRKNSKWLRELLAAPETGPTRPKADCRGVGTPKAPVAAPDPVSGDAAAKKQAGQTDWRNFREGFFG